MSYFNFEKPDPQKFLDYVRTRGNSGRKTVELLSKNAKFLESFNTEIGFEVLKDLCVMHEGALEKIAELKASEEDKMRYKVLGDLITRWATRISSYYEVLDKISK